MQRLTPVALALGVAWGISPAIALAQSNEPAVEAAPRLKEVTVTATRTARRVDDVPSTVSVITDEQVEEEGARDLKDLLKRELDVSLRTGPARHSVASGAGRSGVESVNIRGLEGNQVLMTVDGIRVPSVFDFSPITFGRGDYVEVEGLKTAEVLRGPTSTQYGSDGLAGALTMQTLDPADVLKAGQSVGGFTRLGYASVDRSWVGTVAVAGRNAEWEGLFLNTYRTGHETENQGTNYSLNSTRTAPNPLDYRGHYVLAKGIWHASAAHQWTASFERQSRKTEVDSLSTRSATSLAFLSTDRVERDRLAIEHRYTDLNGAWLQKAKTMLYWQSAKTNQFSYEDRIPAVDRTRDNTYKMDTVGLSTQFESNFSGSFKQRVTYGLDLMRSESSSIRSGTVPTPPDVFPSKIFPDTAYTTVGAFVQSEIEAGELSIIPGLRFDHYDIKASPAGFPGAVVNTSDQAVTPRLGVVWRLEPGFSPYAQWARGFRAPTPDQVNNGYENLAGTMGAFYRTIGNPNLKPERSNSFEVGARGKVNAWRYAVSAFNNRYADFISREDVGGSNTALDPTIFQYINLSNVRIKGLEMRNEWAIDSRWTATAGFAYAKGSGEKAGVKAPLNTINPLKAVLGARYDVSEWSFRANVTHNQGKQASDINGAMFASPGYTTLDLGMTWKPRRNLTVNANLNNVFDTTYWRWSDVRDLASASTIKDAYTAPGRNFQVSLRVDF